MSLIDRAARALALRAEPAEPAADPVTAAVTTTQRERTVWTAPNRAATISAVYTAVLIIATAVEQLSIDVERNNQTIDCSAFIARPDPDLNSRSDWLHEVTTSLALHGNAYLRVWRDAAGHALVARVLNPATCIPFIDDRTGRKLYDVNGRAMTGDEITHLRMMKRPGQLLGLGPIQAAQAELAGHRDVVDASTNWFRDSGTPAGYLRTDQSLTPEQARNLLDSWNSVPAGRTRLTSNGLTYERNIINPRDAQWLESRRFSKTEIMDLFGVPASLTLGVDKGDSQTYANVSQDWLGFVRFRLMRYVREIEEALSSLIPRGQQARANLEALLRSDAKTRMEIHAIAIAAGVYSGDYARQIEHIPASAGATTTSTAQEVTS